MININKYEVTMNFIAMAPLNATNQITILFSAFKC